MLRSEGSKRLSNTITRSQLPRKNKPGLKTFRKGCATSKRGDSIDNEHIQSQKFEGQKKPQTPWEGTSTGTGGDKAGTTCPAKRGQSKKFTRQVREKSVSANPANDTFWEGGISVILPAGKRMQDVRTEEGEGKSPRSVELSKKRGASILDSRVLNGARRGKRAAKVLLLRGVGIGCTNVGYGAPRGKRFRQK